MPTISPEQWHRIERVVDAALTLSPNDRAAYLDRMCSDDPWMRSAVDGWLDACGDAGDFLAQPDADARALLERAAASVDPQTEAGARIGPYRIVGEIARGRMG